MKKIEPMKWPKPHRLAAIEKEGRLDGIRHRMGNVVWMLKEMVEKLTHEDYMHLQLNADAVVDGLDELKTLHDRYRTIQGEK